LYAAIDIEKLLLKVTIFGPHGTDLATTFLARLCEKHNLSGTEFVVDQFGYRTGLARLELSDQVNCPPETLWKMENAGQGVQNQIVVSFSYL